MFEESDADLLQYVAWGKDYPREAKEAFAVFYGRHAEFLFGVCVKRFGKKLPTYLTVDDLVGDTFVRVLERAGTFSAGGEHSPDAVRRLARAWLIAIAHNLLNDAYRGRPTNEQSRDEEFFDQLTATEPPEDSPRVRLVARAFAEVLDARDREVLRVTFYWNKPGAKQQRLPNDVSADLAKTLRTTPENVRKIRASAIAKVKAFIEQAESQVDNTR